jgi:hypothetical protein
LFFVKIYWKTHIRIHTISLELKISIKKIWLARKKMIFSLFLDISPRTLIKVAIYTTVSYGIQHLTDFLNEKWIKIITSMSAAFLLCDVCDIIILIFFLSCLNELCTYDIYCDKCFFLMKMCIIYQQRREMTNLIVILLYKQWSRDLSFNTSD